MGDYITIQWGSSPPATTEAPENNCAVLGRDPLTGDDKYIKITSAEDAWDAGVSEDSDLGRFISSFYSQDGVGACELTIIPFNDTQFSGETKEKVACTGTAGTWYVSAQPCHTIYDVQVDFGDGSGFVTQTLDTHYTLETIGSEKTGKITFTENGPVNSNNEIVISGEVPPGGRVRASYTTTGFQQALELLNEDDIDVSFVGFAYDTEDPLSFSTGNASGLFADFKALKTHCNAAVNNNKWRMGIVALPSDARPNASATSYGGTSTWGEIRSDVGTTRNMIIVHAKPTLTNDKPDDDPAAVIMGVIAAAHPHKNLTLSPVTMGVREIESRTYQQGWKEAQVIYLMKERLDSAGAYRIAYGSTLGTNRENRINNVRCKYLTARILYGQLFSFLAQQTARYDFRGLDSIENCVRGTLDYIRRLGYIDDINSVSVVGKELFAKPYNSLTEAQKATYTALKESKIVTVAVEYMWSGNIEKIVLNPVIEV